MEEHDEDYKPYMVIPGNPDIRKVLPDELRHHGVKGMKWGVHNEETKYRYGELTRPNTRKMFDKVDDVKVTNLTDKNKMFRDMHPDAFPIKVTTMTSEQDQAKVNPFYQLAKTEAVTLALQSGQDPLEVEKAFDESFYTKGYTNCAACSIVYDLRKRGYDIDVNMSEKMATELYKNIDKYYPGAQVEETSTLEEADEQLSDMPVGARGYIGGLTVNGSGHAIAWEMTENGLVYRDCQSNKSYTSDTIDQVFDAQDWTLKTNDPMFHYARLDELQPDLEKIYERGIISETGMENDEGLRKDRYKDAIEGYKDVIENMLSYKPDVDQAIKWTKDAIESGTKALNKGHSPYVDPNDNIIKNMKSLREGIIRDDVKEWYKKKKLQHSIENVEAFQDEHYGLPDKKKYPMPDRDHVLSAIRFFNYVDPLDERKLAKAILKRMDELGITDINVGEVNRFKQYYDKHF